MHFYDGVLDRSEVQSFLDAVFAEEEVRKGNMIADGQTSTMTVAVPSESGECLSLYVQIVTEE
jgi:hypothetical protein